MLSGRREFHADAFRERISIVFLHHPPSSSPGSSRRPRARRANKSGWPGQARPRRMSRSTRRESAPASFPALTLNRAGRLSVLQLVFQGRALAHLGARLVLFKVGLVVDRGLQDYLIRNRLFAQVSHGDFDREAADDETIELPGGQHLVRLDEVDRFLAP